VVFPGGRCVEDLLNVTRYVDAINSCLRAWGTTHLSIGANDMGTKARPSAVSAWTKAIGVKEPGHTDVVSEILRAYDDEDPVDRRLLGKAQVGPVKVLYASLLGALGISSEEAGLYRP